MERAECSVFIGKYQILQMTLSPLQWHWSPLVQHGAWCWMQEEQLGGSLRNRPADYLQLCWELSFLNIHIFNQLKRLSLHIDAVQKKKSPSKHSCTSTQCITLVNQLHGKDAGLWLWFMIVQFMRFYFLSECWALSGKLFIMSCKHICLQYGSHWKYIWQHCEQLYLYFIL